MRGHPILPGIQAVSSQTHGYDLDGCRAEILTNERDAWKCHENLPPRVSISMKSIMRRDVYAPSSHSSLVSRHSSSLIG